MQGLHGGVCVQGLHGGCMRAGIAWWCVRAGVAWWYTCVEGNWSSGFAHKRGGEKTGKGRVKEKLLQSFIFTFDSQSPFPHFMILFCDYLIIVKINGLHLLTVAVSFLSKKNLKHYNILMDVT